MNNGMSQTFVTIQSQESTQDLDKWDKLANVLYHANDEIIESLKEKLKLDEICINGYTNALVHQHKKAPLEDNILFDDFLKKLGFTKEEIYQTRKCVLSGCPFQTSSIGALLNHKIGHHKIKIREIGKLVSAIKNDTRKPLEGKEAVKNAFLTTHMGTE
jgi:hypothetical protein